MAVKILITTDVHGCVCHEAEAGRIGYARLKTCAQALRAEGHTVFVLDGGDAFSGSPYAVADAGRTIARIMGQVGYRLQVPGNHALDYALCDGPLCYSQGLVPLVRRNNQGPFDAVVMNARYRGGPVPGLLHEPCVIYDARRDNPHGIRVVVAGVLSPYTVRHSLKKLLQEYDVGLLASPEQTRARLLEQLTESLRPYDRPEDVVIVLAHIGMPLLRRCGDTRIVGQDLTAVPHVDFVADGHSHHAMLVQQEGRAVYGNGGKYLEHLLCITIEADGQRRMELLSHEDLAGCRPDAAVEQTIQDLARDKGFAVELCRLPVAQAVPHGQWEQSAPSGQFGPSGQSATSGQSAPSGQSGPLGQSGPAAEPLPLEVSVRGGDSVCRPVPSGQSGTAVRSVLSAFRPGQGREWAVGSEALGRTEQSFSRARLWQGNAPLGRLLCLAMCRAAEADVALFASAGIRAELPGPVVTVRDLYTVLPFGDELVRASLSGEQLYRLCVQKVEKPGPWALQFHGLRLYCWAGPDSPGQRAGGDNLENSAPSEPLARSGLPGQSENRLRSELRGRPEPLQPPEVQSPWNVTGQSAVQARPDAARNAVAQDGQGRVLSADSAAGAQSRIRPQPDRGPLLRPYRKLCLAGLRLADGSPLMPQRQYTVALGRYLATMQGCSFTSLGCLVQNLRGSLCQELVQEVVQSDAGLFIFASEEEARRACAAAGPSL